MATKTLTGTPAWLGAMNDRAALSLLLEQGTLTRNQLAALSGLSKPTAAQMIARLDANGLVEPVGALSGGRGPKAVSYGIRRRHTWGVAIDVQPEVIRSTVVDAVGGSSPVVEKVMRRGHYDHASVDELRRAVDRACDAADTDPSEARVAVLGIQGAVHPKTGELVFTDELPDWPRQHVREELEAALGMELLIHNDVKLAAVAERTNGAGENAASFVLFWVGNGLGLAADIGGALNIGATGGAGEIGYLGVPREATLIDPTAITLEDFISGDAIAGIARRHGVNASTFGETLLAIQNDPRRHAIFAELAPRIAICLSPVLAVLDPELLILGGPTGIAGGSYLADLVYQHVSAQTRWSPTVLTAGISENPVLQGARQLLMARLREILLATVSEQS